MSTTYLVQILDKMLRNLLKDIVVTTTRYGDKQTVYKFEVKNRD